MNVRILNHAHQGNTYQRMGPAQTIVYVHRVHQAPLLHLRTNMNVQILNHVHQGNIYQRMGPAQTTVSAQHAFQEGSETQLMLSRVITVLLVL